MNINNLIGKSTLALAVVACVNTADPKRNPVGTYELITINAVPVTAENKYSGTIQLTNDNVFVQTLTYPYLGLPFTETISTDYLLRGDSVIVFFTERRVIFLFNGRTLRTDWNIGQAVFAR